MRKLWRTMLCVILCATLLSASAQTPLTWDQKVGRLGYLFPAPFGFTLPLLPENANKDSNFLALQSFSDQVHHKAISVSIHGAAQENGPELARVSFPSGWERLMRAQSVKTEVIQQPKLVQITDSAGSVGYQNNPGKLLWKLSSVTDYALVVPTTSDIQGQASALHDADVDLRDPHVGAFCSDHLAQNSDGKSEDKNGQLRNCLLRSGGRYMPARIASAFKTTFNWSQNPKVNSSTKYIVPSQYAELNQIFSGQIDFDPNKIFVNGSDWASAYKAAVAYGDVQEEALVRFISSKCTVPDTSQTDTFRESLPLTAACVKQFTGPHGWAQGAALLTPTVSFVEKSNFDFLVSNGLLVPNPYTTKRLADLTFTVDLTRFIASAKSRQDALGMLVAARKKKASPPPDSNWKEVDELVSTWAAQPEELNKNGSDSLYEKLLAALVRLRRTMDVTSSEKRP